MQWIRECDEQKEKKKEKQVIIYVKKKKNLKRFWSGEKYILKINVAHWLIMQQMHFLWKFLGPHLHESMQLWVSLMDEKILWKRSYASVVGGPA